MAALQLPVRMMVSIITNCDRTTQQHAAVTVIPHRNALACHHGWCGLSGHTAHANRTTEATTHLDDGAVGRGARKRVIQGRECPTVAVCGVCNFCGDVAVVVVVLWGKQATPRHGLRCTGASHVVRTPALMYHLNFGPCKLGCV